MTAEAFATVPRMPSAPCSPTTTARTGGLPGAEREERRREERRREIMATLRRLKEEAGDPAALAARERAKRHADVLERYPPLF